jgi:hypothetical protein
VIRSGLWEQERWPEIDALPTLAQVMVAHAKLPDDPAELQSTIDKVIQEQLY